MSTAEELIRLVLGEIGPASIETIILLDMTLIKKLPTTPAETSRLL